MVHGLKRDDVICKVLIRLIIEEPGGEETGENGKCSKYKQC